MSIQHLVDQYINEASEILKSKNLKCHVDTVILSSRMSRTLGAALFKERAGNFYTYSIKISSKAFTCDSKKLRNTVFHEVAHIADHQNYKKFGHGVTWKYLMNVLGYDAEIYYDAEAVEEEIGHKHETRKNKRYIFACVTCKREYQLTSQKLKKLKYYKCHCRGEIENTGRVE